jgi:hypothetical protein
MRKLLGYAHKKIIHPLPGLNNFNKMVTINYKALSGAFSATTFPL